MTRPYQIERYPARDLLVLRLFGFWDERTVAVFIADVNAAVASLPCGAGNHRVITDLTEFAVQSQAVSNLIVTYIRTAEPRAARAAWIGGQGLQFMQARRTVHGTGARLFSDIAEARRWIAGDEA